VRSQSFGRIFRNTKLFEWHVADIIAQSKRERLDMAAAAAAAMAAVLNDDDEMDNSNEEWTIRVRRFSFE
jgi:hypothetical protein